MKDIPTVPAALTIIGILPFLLVAASIFFLIPEEMQQMLFFIHKYAILLLVFMGGINWGMAINHEKNASSIWIFIWSVIPLLLALAIQILPLHYFYLWVIAGIIVQWIVNWGALCLDICPNWYLKLNTVGSVCAILGILVLMIFAASATA